MEPLKEFKYQHRVQALRNKKLEQTQNKIKLEGLLDEDDYGRIAPLEDGWQERIDLCNLYPLLVHVNLFGGGYAAQVRQILRHFV